MKPKIKITKKWISENQNESNLLNQKQFHSSIPLIIFIFCESNYICKLIKHEISGKWRKSNEETS